MLDNIVVNADTPIFEIAEKLQAGNDNLNGFLVVIDDEKRVIGCISDGDLRRAYLKMSEFATSLVAEDIMNSEPILFEKGLLLKEILKGLPEQLALRKRNPFSIIRHLIIVNDLCQLVRVMDISEFTLVSEKPIAVLGLGYVGLTLALVMSDLGFKIQGIETNQEVLSNLNRCVSHVREPDIENMLLRNVGKTLKLDSNLNESFNTYIISVGTPLKLVSGELKLNTEYLYSVLDSISKVLTSGNLIILRSTVPIGTCRDIVIPYLESQTKKICGIDFFVAFAPERTEEGNALRELTTLPQIIGGYDEISVLKAKKIFERITNNIVILDSLEEAEMVKLLNNSFRDYVFAFSNQSARVASQYNLDINKVIKAANYKYPRNPIPFPSPGVGGPCLTKDPYIFEKSSNLGNTPLFIQSRKENELMTRYVFDVTKNRLKYLGKELSVCKVLCCGLAFKGNPRTGDLRNSTGVEIYQFFSVEANEICGHDFEADKDEMQGLNINVSSIESGFKDVDVVLFLNNHVRYKDLAINELCRKSKTDVLLVDCWGLFEASRFDDHIKYSNISKSYF